MSDEQGVRITCRQVTKIYSTATSRVEALRGIDAIFEAGAFTAIMGPSGSGKSSLLRILGGLDRPTTGNVSIGGNGVEMDPSDARGTGVRYIFQAPAENLLPYLTVGQHLASFSHGHTEGAGNILEELGMNHRVDHRPHQLSGGEQQRAGLAHALVGLPTFIIADEPTSELDHRSAELLINAMRKRTDTGVGFIVATHDPRILGVVDRIVHIEWGKMTHPDDSSVAPAGPRRTSDGSTHEPLVVVKGVQKTYGQGSLAVRALTDVDVEVRKGEFVALMGPSGSGKSTLLNVVAGWETADRGDVSWSIPIGRPPAWSDLSVMPQALGLMDELDLGGNARLPFKLGGRTGDVTPLMGDLKVDHLTNRYPGEVSLGEQQRCALVRSMSLRPALLVLDEPTGHQDLASVHRILNVFHRVAELGTSLLVATHDDEVADAADRVIYMADGRVVEER